jgi:hypothetical protein
VPRPFALIIVLIIALFAVMWGLSAFMAPFPGGGWWGMGPGMMRGPSAWGGYGPGTPGYGPSMMYGPDYGRMGPWAWAPGSYGQGNLNLTIDDVKNYLGRWIAWQGNSRLKVGDVNEKDADTIVADIVTKDNSLVQRFVINRHNGYFRPSED